MKIKLSEEERRIRQIQYYTKYRQSEKGRMATRKAALRYYHKTKVLKKKYPNVEVSFSQSILV